MTVIIRYIICISNYLDQLYRIHACVYTLLPLASCIQCMDSITIIMEIVLQVAMGQGQATVAIQLLRECASKGHWLCLKNIHLVTSWLPALEKVRAVCRQ